MAPTLHHYQEFKEVLADYHVSDRARHAIRDLKLVVLLGPSSGGRNTIIRQQVASGRYHHIISDTTRPPRRNDGTLEKNGIDYYFRAEDEMLADLKAGEFLEAEIIHGQQVSGISIRELEKAKSQHKIAINDIEVGGVHNVMKIKPDSCAVMIVPPSFKEWQQRLVRRGAMPDDEYKRRMETAEKIFKDAFEQTYYKFVISESVSQSSAIIDAIVRGELSPHQDRARDVIEGILISLKARLSELD